MSELTPQEVVEELDRFIVGQPHAKRALAIALRERERRKRLRPEQRAEVGSKNILIIGPTGVGKTELARRLARLVDAPFIKVEATTFTEVGYVGRDVETIVRDLADAGVSMVQRERLAEVREKADKAAHECLLNILLAPKDESDGEQRAASAEPSRLKRRRRAIERRLADHSLDERMVEIEVDSDELSGTMLEFASGLGSDEIHEQFQEFVQSVGSQRRRSRRVSVREARRILAEQEANKLIDWEDVVDTAVRRVEDSGIVFIDEMDKLINRSGEWGPDVSGDGVQRDLLPVVEGAAVGTRYGVVHTDHILFIGAGAFNRARPSELLPELQGRFPIRVEVRDLGEQEFVSILTEPENALTRQYAALMQTEDVTLQFTEDGVAAIAHYAAELNARTENLGARRLYGVMERVLEEVSFQGPALAGQSIQIDAAYVQRQMAGIPFTDDASKYIL